MGKILAQVLSCMMLFSLSACGINGNSNESNASMESAKPSVSKNETSEASMVSKYTTSQPNNTKEAAKEEKMTTINITIGNTTFTATLENNDTAKAFAAQLPLVVDMSELNGNEKYSNLSSNLREDRASSPGTINEGDLMLYGNNCLVLFYETFNTSYSYVRLGHINDTTGLAKALGAGNVQVTFSVGH